MPFDSLRIPLVSFGLDFSDSPPNEKNERFLQNAKMSPYTFSPDILNNYVVTDSHWIRTGNIYSSCYHKNDFG